MSLALSQDVILFSSPPSLSHSIFWPQWWAAALVFAVIHRHAYGDLSLGALKRTKVNDKLSFCLSFPLSVSVSSPPQSEVFNLPCSPGQGFGICQSPQACLGPQSSEWIPERWKRVEKWDTAQRKQGQKSTGICIGLRFLILFSSFFSQPFYCSIIMRKWRDSSGPELISFSHTACLRLPFCFQWVAMDSQGWEVCESDPACFIFTYQPCQQHIQPQSQCCDILRLSYFPFLCQFSIKLTNWKSTDIFMVPLT